MPCSGGEISVPELKVARDAEGIMKSYSRLKRKSNT
jgi:hypothetical protein